MDSSQFNKIFIILFIILYEAKFILNGINDDYESNELETGDYDILDFNDYHNLKLIITTSKNIYKGIPPILFKTTTANLINATSFISINENFLLAACTQDNLLIKIKLSDSYNSSYSSMINYDYFNDLQLTVPTTTCSLSILGNIVFIGYTRIDYYENETNKTNIVFRFYLKNLNDNNGPGLDEEKENIYFIFPESTIKTDSPRQISCEPLNISNFDSSKHNCNDYRLLCIHESFDLFESQGKNLFQVYSTLINDEFNGFENNSMRFYSIYRSNQNLGFRLHKINSTHARCVMKKVVYDLFLRIKVDLTFEKKSFKPLNLNNKFDTNLDLFYYNNKLLFTSEKISNKYYFGIYNESSINYLKIFDFRENNIISIRGYYDETNTKNNILCVYKTPTNIKYFTLTNQGAIFDIAPFAEIFEVKSNEVKTYDFNLKIEISNIGNIQIEGIIRNNSGTITKQNYPTNLNQLLMEGNIFISEKSLNTWYTYTFAFIDVNDNYAKIYYLADSVINISTCYNISCGSCSQHFNQCDDECPINEAKLRDSPNICHNINKLKKGYIYNSVNNLFEKCYKSCDFCSESSEDSSSHKCESCANGYLFSNKYPGNCYKINSLQTTEDKIVNNIDDEDFEQSICDSYKIESTGECVEHCQSTTPFFSFEYNSDQDNYSKIALNPPKYLFNKKCYESCPPYSISDNDICKCQYAFYNDNQNIRCYSDNNCLSDYPYKNPDTNECYLSLDDCFSKGNNYFFNKECFKDQCPNGEIALETKSEEIKNYFKNNLLLDDNLISKLCICDLINNTNKVWSNITSNEQYFQECLDKCQNGYIPEPFTNQCIVQLPTTIITTIPETTIITTLPETTIITTLPETTIITTLPEATIITSLPETTIITTLPETTIITTLLENSVFNTFPETSIITTLPQASILTELPEVTILNSIPSSTQIIERETEIIIPEEYYKNPDNCLVIYKNKCYQKCPDSTCLTIEDPSLMFCIPAISTSKIYNNICFMNFEEITKNIKTMSDNKEIISKSGVIIRGYSTKSNEIDNNANYSIVELGDCENKIREYYHLENDTELFILGIDSPNKNKSYTTNVYNFGIYLENGTLLEHSIACKNIKISVSSVITNTDLVKLKEASYFNDLGYDIYDKNSNFYTDVCSPASINENDIILSDRKKDFYPSNISLCNESCYYYSVNFNSKRFNCECDNNYNYSENNSMDEIYKEKEDDASYLDYFLSLINYKIGVCYKLFFDFKSYYYNAGFYIGVATLAFCLSAKFIFISLGMKTLNKIILENTPNKKKLLDGFKKQKQKEYDLALISKKFPCLPPKRKSSKIINQDASSSGNLKNEKAHIFNKRRKSILINPKKINILEKINRNRNKAKTNFQFLKSKNLNFISNSITINLKRNSQKKLHSNIKTKSIRKDSMNLLNEQNTNTIRSKSTKTCSQRFYEERDKRKAQKGKIITDEYLLKSYISDEQVDKKEYNSIPYNQALRIDKRGCHEMFLSVLAHEIQIIDIFYYKNPYTHLSILLSIYIFELCLDLTMNCFLYTEEVVSEKYNNDGSIGFFTSLSLSFMSNIFSGLITYVVGKLADYADAFELMIKETNKKNQYLLIVLKFKKYLKLKMAGFFIIQTIINICMCYYLMVFCTVYHKTQGSIMLNYFIGIAESMSISLGLTIITSLIRYFSLKNKWKNVYNTSKYFFEHF